MANIQVLGLCRFSYPAALGSFQSAHATMDERLAALYNPNRLNDRLFFFRNILLPGIRMQSDSDFTLILLLGSDLPEPWRSQLLALVSDVPQIQVAFHETAPHKDVYRELFMAHRNKSADAVAEFRLDDDDAVAVNYVQRVRRAFASVRPLMRRGGRAALDELRGAVLSYEPRRIKVTPLRARGWAAGLTVFVAPDDPQCVMDYPHQKIWQRMPVVSQGDQMMFLRGAHGSNDSHVSVSGGAPIDLDQDRLENVLLARFGVNLAETEQLWVRQVAQQSNGT